MGLSSQQVIERTREYAQSTLSGEGTGHDWWHVERVWNTAKVIAEQEGANSLVVELAALLHDIADWKFHDGDEEEGARVSRVWLDSLGVDAKVIDQVCAIISQSSYKGAGVDEQILSLEGKILQDADRLDAIGAIGIARCFAYGGYAGRELHNPTVAPELHTTAQAYKSNTAPSVNHFYEKLLLLKDRMYTDTAKRIAGRRHDYMQGFLNQFYAEWKGEK